jgi:tetratricopeptide (TPR) repeat protein
MPAQAQEQPVFDVKGPLVLYASLERGNQLVSGSAELPRAPEKPTITSYVAPRQRAFEMWKRALRHKDSDPALSGEIAKRIEAVSIGAANELKTQSRPFVSDKKWDAEIACLTAGIDLLKTAVEIAKTERLAMTLSALLVERGMSHLQGGETMQRQNAAVSDMDEAMRVHLSEHAKKQAAGAYNARGCNKQNSNQIGDFTRAIQLYPQGLFYANRAVSYMQSSQYDHAIEDLVEAFKLEGKLEYKKLAASAYNAKGMDIVKKAQNQAGYGYGGRSAVMRELREAMTCFKSAVDLDPSVDAYLSNLQFVLTIPGSAR